MLFNSAEYLFLFLPLVFVVFIFLSRGRSTEGQITWLILASLYFYGSWNPVYLLLILSSIIVNFQIGRKLAATEPAGRQLWLLVGVTFNLCLLGYFKYAGFFVDSLNGLGNWLIPVPEITLPLAISFFTFQQIAYLVDVSRDECQEYQFRHYTLFVLFFPQLIAGPIVHHKEIMPQFSFLRPAGQLRTDISVGLTIIVIGLFKKVVMADSLSELSDPIYTAAAQGQAISTLDAWIATLGFSFQIYFDFSGYSDIAIGSARLFGIKLPENFRSPYKSRSVIEVWSRWHITLSRFLKDYLYIALGGNRKGKVSRYRNLFLTMLLGGLWHGAAWTYVMWGGLHGLFLCINHAWRALQKALGISWISQNRPLNSVYLLLTFLAWSVATVVFRSHDLSSALVLIQSAFIDFSSEPQRVLTNALTESLPEQIMLLLGLEADSYTVVYPLLALSAAICWLLPSSQEFMHRYDPVIPSPGTELDTSVWISWRPTVFFACGFGAILSLSLLKLSSITEFFYFQF
ncbi:MAG: MBOAT family O-acyltransferase [Halioglobus sp.]